MEGSFANHYYIITASSVYVNDTILSCLDLAFLFVGVEL